MACGSLTGVIQRSLVAQSGLAAYEWFTPWIPCTGMDTFTAVLKNKNVSGPFRSQVAAQYAAVRTDAPGTPAAYGQSLAGAGESCVASGNIAATTGPQLYVRFGVKYDLSTGTTAASADVELQVSYDSCGQIVGAVTEQLAATSATKIFLAVTPWVPALHAFQMKAAMVVSSLSGNFKWRMTYRTAETSKEVPGAWVDDWDPTNNPERGGGEVNTGEIAPTTTGKMWIQFGIEYYLAAGFSFPGQASVTATVAVRK